MSTRGMLAIQWYANCDYELLYRHNDTYPTSLGVQLMELLQASASFNFKREQIIEELQKLGLEDKKRSVTKPEEAFLRIQGDLEWIYSVELQDRADLSSLTISRTSNPHEFSRQFVFRVWFGYVRFFPNHHFYEEMLAVERSAGIALNCLEAYESGEARTKSNT